MNAFVSGVAARVVFVEGNDVTYFEADAPNDLKKSSLSELGCLLAGATDLVELKRADKAAVFQCLLDLWNKDRAIRMLDIILDESSQEFSSEAVEYLDALLSESTTPYVLNWALAVPAKWAPPTDKISTTYSKVQGLISTIVGLQESIRQVRLAWEGIDPDLFESPSYKAKFERAAVVEGVFRQFVLAVAGQEDLNDALLAGYVSLRPFRNVRSIIQAWEAGLTVRRSAQRVLDRITITADANEDEDLKPGVREVGSYEAYQRVLRAKEGIVDRLERSDLVNARKFARALVDEQIANGDRSHAAKTLCALAQEANRLGYTSLQLEWVLQAVEVNPEDGWAAGQAADAFLVLYRFSDAADYYRRAMNLGEELFGMNGLGRVLRASGNLDAALATFREARDQFSSHAEVFHSWAGIGEVLRDMGDLDAALKVYTDAVERYREIPSLWCGRAATLKDLGELDMASAAYNEAMLKFPGEVTAQVGLADIEKTLGNFDSALQKYEKVIDQLPSEVAGYRGYAEVLREKGQSEEALVAYAQAKKRFPHDPGSYGGYAETLRDMGRLDEALDAYNEAVARFEFEPYLRNGRANLIKLTGRLEEALQAYDQNVHDFPYSLVALNGRADLLKELGHYERALSAFDDIAAKQHSFKVALFSKAAVLTILGRFEEALDILPETSPRTRDEWIAYHIRGMIYLRSGRVEQAIEVFEFGLSHIQFHKERSYFQNALAAAKLARSDYLEALNLSRNGRSTMAKVIQLHSYSALGERKVARGFYDELRRDPHSNVIDLAEEIARRFRLVEKPPAHSSAWIIQKEQELVLALAA